MLSIYYIKSNCHKRSPGITVGGRNYKFCRKIVLREVRNENSLKLENVAMVTLKFWIAHFEALFDQEGVRICHLYLKLA